MKKEKITEAFSLVEVVMAIGIVSFCMLSLVGLLPVGLSAVKDAREQAAAAIAVEQVSNAIRNANVTAIATSSISYKAAGAYSNLTWSTGGATVAQPYSLSLGGLPSSAVTDQRLSAHVEIYPPADSMTSGTAIISIAWPPAATWNDGTKRWVNAQGSMSTWLIFTPGQ